MGQNRVDTLENIKDQISAVLRGHVQEAVNETIEKIVSNIVICKNDNCNNIFLKPPGRTVHCSPQCRHNFSIRQYEQRKRGRDESISTNTSNDSSIQPDD